jgi:hypothetical protein
MALLPPIPDNQSGNMGGSSSAPNRAPAAKVIQKALANTRVANQVVAALSGLSTPAAIIATHADATTDFAALMVGDIVLHIPATAGNTSFGVVATAGTAPAAAVVGDLYLVHRPVNLDSNIGTAPALV